jgi:hypothetical protein
VLKHSPHQRSVTVTVAADPARAIGILGIRLWAAAVARAGERCFELALDHRLNELAHPIPQTCFDRIKPVIEKMQPSALLTARMTTSCYCWSWCSLHRRTNAGIVWVSAPGDYALFNSNHIPDGT